MSDMDEEWRAFVQAAVAQAYAGREVTASSIAGELRRQGYDLVVGQTPPVLAPLVQALNEDGVPLVREAREEALIGFAFGALLGGRSVLVTLAGASVGGCINALTALPITHACPMLLLVERGAGGNPLDEMGDRLLEAIGVRYRIPRTETLLGDLDWARSTLEQTRGPVALFLRPGVIS